MKRILIIIAVTITIIGCGRTKTDYQNQVENFTFADVDFIKKKISNKESFILYIGRESCQYCIEFVPTLVELVRENNNLEIFYLDVEHITPSIEDFRREYDINYVPQLMKFLVEDEHLLATKFDVINDMNLSDFVK